MKKLENEFWKLEGGEAPERERQTDKRVASAVQDVSTLPSKEGQSVRGGANEDLVRPISHGRALSTSEHTVLSHFSLTPLAQGARPGVGERTMNQEWLVGISAGSPSY